MLRPVPGVRSGASVLDALKLCLAEIISTGDKQRFTYPALVQDIDQPRDALAGDRHTTPDFAMLDQGWNDLLRCHTQEVPSVVACGPAIVVSTQFADAALKVIDGFQVKTT